MLDEAHVAGHRRQLPIRQQIQRYESTGHGGPAWLACATCALGVEVRKVVSLPTADAA